LISVSSPSAGSTTATLSAWTKTASKGWVKVKGFDGLTAYVGAQGVGNADENHSRTPAGSFTLTFAFGNKSDPGTRLPYHHVDSNDIWVGDSNSKYYNTLQSCPSARISSCGPPSEDLSAIGSLYNYAALIDYNTANSPTGVVPHEGSAFFLHVTNYEPTGGCVAIPQDKVIALLKWLDPAKHPRIVIGVL
jgi:L,D-peptidoglycan transpeptidase YkuD (ErfK/YbiS/YcfS/YnhG family)